VAVTSSAISCKSLREIALAQQQMLFLETEDWAATNGSHQYFLDQDCSLQLYQGQG